MSSLLLPEARARFHATLNDPKANGLTSVESEAGAYGVMLRSALDSHDAFDALLRLQIAAMQRVAATLDDESDERQELVAAIYTAQCALRGLFYTPPTPPSPKPAALSVVPHPIAA